MHTYLHTCVLTYIHSYIYAYNTYIYTYIHTYIRTYTHTYIHTYIHAYILMCIRCMHTHCIHYLQVLPPPITFIPTYSRTRILVCSYTHTLMYSYTHVYVYVNVGCHWRVYKANESTTRSFKTIKGNCVCMYVCMVCACVICEWMLVCMYARTYVCMSISIRACILSTTYHNTHTYLLIPTYLHSYIHIYTYIHAYVHTYIHVHTFIPLCRGVPRIVLPWWICLPFEKRRCLTLTRSIAILHFKAFRYVCMVCTLYVRIVWYAWLVCMVYGICMYVCMSVCMGCMHGMNVCMYVCVSECIGVRVYYMSIWAHGNMSEWLIEWESATELLHSFVSITGLISLFGVLLRMSIRLSKGPVLRWWRIECE